MTGRELANQKGISRNGIETIQKSSATKGSVLISNKIRILGRKKESKIVNLLACNPKLTAIKMRNEYNLYCEFSVDTVRRILLINNGSIAEEKT